MYCLLFLFLTLAKANTLPKENILQFPYGTNFKFNGLLHHRVERVWVVTKLPIPNMDTIPFPTAELELSCEHIISASKEADRARTASISSEAKKSGLNFMKKVCTTSQPIFNWMKQKQDHYKQTVENLIVKELTRLTPQAAATIRTKRFLAAFLPSIAGLISIAVEQLSGHLQKKRQKAFKHGLKALKNDISEDIVKQFNDELILFGKYNLQGMKNILATIHNVNNRSSTFADTVVGHLKNWQQVYLSSKLGPELYSHHLQLYLHVVQSRNFELYESLITVLELYLRAVGTLTRGYLPPELFPPSRLQPIISKALTTIKSKHPHYVPSLDSLSDYYDMPLVTFCLDLDNTFVISFPILVQPRATVPLTLFEIETVKVPINDTNTSLSSYTEVVVPKPYIAATSLHYIQLRLPELRMCKHVAYFYFCEEVFLLKSRYHHTCTSTLLYNMSHNTIMDKCQFNLYPNASVMPSILDGGATLVLANYAAPKSLECFAPTPRGFSLPSASYVKVNKSILCYCEITSGLTSLKSTLSACSNSLALNFSFTINLPFLTTVSPYLNLTILKELPQYESSMPFQIPFAIETNNKFSEHILLKDYAKFIAEFESKNNLSFKRGQSRSKKPTVKAPKRLSFLSQILRYLTVAAVTICVVMILALCFLAVKHFKLSLLVGGLMTTPTTEAFTIDLESPQKVSCQEPWLTFFVAIVSLLGVCIYIFRSCKKMTFFKGFKYNNEVMIYVIIGDETHFVPIKVKTLNGNAHMFSLSTNLTKSNLVLQKHYLWDIFQINWNNTKIYKRDVEVSMPKLLYIPLMDKIKIRHIMSQPEVMVYMMIKQGNTWSNIVTDNIVLRPPTSEEA